jgi:hypothetical protein
MRSERKQVQTTYTQASSAVESLQPDQQNRNLLALVRRVSYKLNQNKRSKMVTNPQLPVAHDQLISLSEMVDVIHSVKHTKSEVAGL